jgi:hypothetical protein
MKKLITISTLLTAVMALAGCVSMNDGAVGILEKGQYKVYPGMHSSDVRAALGAPTKTKGPFDKERTEEIYAHLFPDTPIDLDSGKYSMWYYEAEVSTYYYAVVQSGSKTQYKQCYFIFDTAEALRKSTCTNPEM